jgi:hypothetical protein
VVVPKPTTEALMMSAAPNFPKESIESLRAAFENFRNSSGQERPKHPFTLKRRIVDAYRAGLSSAELAAACAVSVASISVWQREIPPEARKLSVVDSPKQVEFVPTAQACLFRLPGGVTMETSRENALWLLSQSQGS